jgi:hypothetical protein
MELDIERCTLIDCLDLLNNKKLMTSHYFGDVNTRGEDLIEINARGRFIAIKHLTLTQVNGTRIETIFSGCWDKTLLTDRDGCAYLDTNPVGFEAILDYFNEIAISSHEVLSPLPSTNAEHNTICSSQMELFGLSIPKIAGSILV